MRSKFLLSALFVSGLITQSAFTQGQSILPHVANGLFPGGSFRTTFVVVNNTNLTATAVLGLTKDNGDPLEVTIPELGTQSTFTLTLAPGAARILQTDGSGNLVSGAATVTSNVPVGASAVFTVLDPQQNYLTEAGVGDSPALSQFTLPVEVMGTFNTGIALYNPSTSPVKMTMRLLDADGTVVGTANLTLPPKNHTARFASELFGKGTCNYSPSCISNFRGSIAITGTGKIAPLVLRQNSSAGTPTYTSLPVTSGVSQGRVPPVLLPKTETGIVLTSNATLNATLPVGFKLTGTVSGSGYSREVFAQSGEKVFSGLVDLQTRKYLIVVPPGSYALTACHIPYSNDAAKLQFDRVYGPVNAGSVQVSGDATKDIALPEVNLFSVSGTVARLDTLPAPAAGESQIFFVSADNTLAAYFPLNEVTGAWQGMLPSGTFSAGIYVVAASHDQVQEITLSNIGSLTVRGGSAIGQFTVPPTAQISGTVTRIGNPTPTGTSTHVTARDASTSSIRCIGSVGGGNIAVPNATGNYQMTVANNRRYGIGVWPLEPSAVFFSPPTANTLNVTGNTTFDLMIPGLPGKVTLTGRVTDANGQPVAHTSITAFSDSIAGAPGITFSEWGQTDASGIYSITLLSGTNYRVTFEPPVPMPSAAEPDKP